MDYFKNPLLMPQTLTVCKSKLVKTTVNGATDH